MGLYFLRARYLDVNSGRFWSMDSFQGSKGDPASLHKYTYAHCNPVNYSDPSGNYTLKEVLTVAFTIVSLALNVYSLGNNIVRFGYARTPREKILAGFAVGVDFALLFASVFGSGFIRPGADYAISKVGELFISLQLGSQASLELSAAIATISLAKILNIGSGGHPPQPGGLVEDPEIRPDDDIVNADIQPNIAQGETFADATKLPTEWTNLYDRYSYRFIPPYLLNRYGKEVAEEAFRVVKPGGSFWITSKGGITQENIEVFEKAGFINVRRAQGGMTGKKPS